MTEKFSGARGRLATCPRVPLQLFDPPRWGSTPTKEGAMSADDQQDYRLDVLRAAGHGDAADLLAKLPKQGPTADAETEQAPEPAQRRMTPADAIEAQRHAEGAELLKQMQGQISSKWFDADEVTR